MKSYYRPMKKFIFILSCSVYLAQGMETNQNDAQKTLQEKIVALVEQQQHSKKQVASDFQIYRLLSLAAKNNDQFYLPYDAIKVIIDAVESNSLQTIFDACEFRGDRSDYVNNPYGYLIEYLNKKNSFELEELFDSLPDQESTLKMALRMLYGKNNHPLRCIERGKFHNIPGSGKKTDKRSFDLDAIGCYFFFNSGGIRRDEKIEIYDSHRFGRQLKSCLKDFLALLQPLLGWQVRALTIQRNEISTIPETLDWFKDLRFIDFSYNNLTQLPEFLSRFKKLEFIKLSDNHLTEVPEVIKHCKHLEELELAGNEIVALPQWLVEYDWKRLEITIDKDVVVPWNKKDYPNIWIRRRIREVHKNGDHEYSRINYVNDR